MSYQFKIGSLFDGSGGFPLAGSLCGVDPVWAAEVEPYPIAVTRSRFDGSGSSPLLAFAKKMYPNLKLYMKHQGDISKINGAEVEPVDVITFGSPCQDLSVAGKRAGLKHEANGDEETTRSGLFMEAVRIIKEMREATHEKYPSFALWENVPGAFSSNKGEDFRVVLEELIKIVEPSCTVPAPDKNGWPYADCYVGAGWSLAYRVFDAQFWGVPQRRRRIHLVLDLRGECAEKVLFEREGLRGYFAESGTPWQGIAGDAEDCVGTADREGVPFTLKIRSGCDGGGKGALIQTDLSATLATNNDQYLFQPITLEPGIAAREGGHIYEGVSGTLRANAGDNQMAVAYAENLVLDDQGGSQINVRTDGKSPTLRAEMHGNVPCVMKPVAYSFDSLASNSMKSSNPHSGCRQVEVAKCLDTTDPNPCKNQGGIAVVQKVYESHPMDSRIKELEDDVSPTVSVKWHKGAADTPLVCRAYSIENHPADSRVSIDESGKVQCLTSRMGTGGGNVPMVMEPICCIDGDKIGKADRAGGSGLGIRPGDVMYTLTAKDAGQHAVAVQTYQKVTGPLMANSHPGSYTGQDAFSDMLVAGCEPITEVQGMDCRNGELNGDLCGTLQAKPNGGFSYNCIRPVILKTTVRYIVRRLTPTECARLQGFADRWGDIDPKSDFSDAEYSFWLEVRNTHARINGKAVKDYTKAQMLTWYNKLLTDSSEYKMWGNGIALPPALYCMQGIVDALSSYREEIGA